MQRLRRDGGSNAVPRPIKDAVGATEKDGAVFADLAALERFTQRGTLIAFRVSPTYPLSGESCLVSVLGAIIDQRGTQRHVEPQHIGRVASESADRMTLYWVQLLNEEQGRIRSAVLEREREGLFGVHVRYFKGLSVSELHSVYLNTDKDDTDIDRNELECFTNATTRLNVQATDRIFPIQQLTLAPMFVLSTVVSPHRHLCSTKLHRHAWSESTSLSDARLMTV